VALFGWLVEPPPSLPLEVARLRWRQPGVEHVAAAAFGERAAALEQQLPNIGAAEALHHRQPLGHGERLEPAHAHGADRLVADIGDDVRAP
jgi:hypothetical protein